MKMSKPQIFHKKNGKTLAYRKTEGALPGVMFLGGFKADMSGTKATYFEKWCQDKGQAYVRFDYSGHGLSSGNFAEGSISRWSEDAIDILDYVTEGPQILVGSSMGGWVMILAALQRKERITGIMGIASAPDFVDPLVYARLTTEQRHALETQGVCYLASAGYEKPYPITQQMIEDGRRCEILKNPIDLHCPVRLVHGMKDLEVPWEFSEKMMGALVSEDVTLTLLKEGNHSLSTENELKILGNTLEPLIKVTVK